MRKPPRYISGSKGRLLSGNLISWHLEAPEPANWDWKYYPDLWAGRREPLSSNTLPHGCNRINLGRKRLVFYQVIGGGGKKYGLK